MAATGLNPSCNQQRGPVSAFVLLLRSGL